MIFYEKLEFFLTSHWRIRFLCIAQAGEKNHCLSPKESHSLTASEEKYFYFLLEQERKKAMISNILIKSCTTAVKVSFLFHPQHEVDIYIKQILLESKT